MGNVSSVLRQLVVVQPSPEVSPLATICPGLAYTLTIPLVTLSPFGIPSPRAIYSRSCPNRFPPNIRKVVA